MNCNNLGVAGSPPRVFAMAKKRSVIEELLDLMDQYDPAVRKLAIERANGRLRNAQLFNSRHHRLKKHIRDETQAIAVLTLARKWAEANGFKLLFSADEQKLLNGYGRLTEANGRPL